MPLLSLPIVGARDETPRTRVIRLDLGGARFDFLAGQYVLLGQGAAAEPRPYSIACSPGQATRHGLLEFLIQVGDDGTPGPHLRRLRVGERVRVEGPDGRFLLPAGPLPPSILFVAGGTGVAPLRSMMWHVLEAAPGTRAGLVLSGRSPSELPFAGEFRQLAREGRLRLVETVTREAPESWQGTRGRVGRAELAAAMASPDGLCYVCGPDSLVEDVPRLLASLGVMAAHVHTEHWADQAADARGAARTVSAEDVEGKP